MYGKGVASVHDRFPLCTNASKRVKNVYHLQGGKFVNIHEKWPISAIFRCRNISRDQDLPVSILN